MSLGRRLVLPLLGLAGLTIFTALHTWAPDTYTKVLTAIMIRPVTEQPFIDLEFLFTTATCWEKGFDVYVVDPCDSLGRPESYSPLWLRAPILFADRPWSVWYGVALAGVFYLSLAVLPAGRRWRDVAVLGLAAFSSATIYGVERGNIDLLIFMMALAGGLCVARSARVRVTGYAMLVAAGLLKFYPIVGLVLALRERFVRFLVIAGVATAIVLAFVLLFQDELVKTLRNVPKSSYFGDNVGARQLPGGLGVAVRSILHGLGYGGAFAETLSGSRLLIAGTALLLVGTVWIVAGRFAGRGANRLALLMLPRPEATLLVLGAVLICGCFFAGQSVAYRGIMLLLVLPGLLALGREPPNGRSRRIAGWTIAAILLVLWRLTIIQALAAHGMQSWAGEGGGGSAIAAVFWLVFELAWWWIVAVLMGVLVAFALDSVVGRQVLGLLRTQPTFAVDEPI